MTEPANESLELLTIKELNPIHPEDAYETLRGRLRRNSFSARLAGHHAARNDPFATRPKVHKTDLLVLSGRDRTDRSGKVVLPIHQLLGGVANEGVLSNTQYVLIREPEFVATPVSRTPVFATFVSRSSRVPTGGGYFLLDRDDDTLDQPVLATVEVEVMMWKHDGTVAGEVDFSWLCTVEAVRKVELGG